MLKISLTIDFLIEQYSDNCIFILNIEKSSNRNEIMNREHLLLCQMDHYLTLTSVNNISVDQDTSISLRE